MAKKKKVEEVWKEIVERAWKDEVFKQRVLKDPKQVLKEYDVDMPDELSIKAVEAPLNVKLIHLPPKPSAGELSEEYLKEIAGGGFNW